MRLFGKKNTHTNEFERKEKQDKELLRLTVRKWKRAIKDTEDYKKYALYKQTMELTGMVKQQAFLMIYEATEKEIDSMWEKR